MNYVAMGSLADLEERSAFRDCGPLYFIKTATVIVLVPHVLPEHSHSPMRGGILSISLKLQSLGDCLSEHITTEVIPYNFHRKVAKGHVSPVSL